ncbi:hypothetical protein A9K75_06570 [Campylobacter fetus subsp. testudinum]|uniref:hypothetical protein n=1 Tax=Campylobacter fetus TaxID=196 RepID=UPI00081888A0|nr:hypothetical protein [Campylobacter fetus]OCR99529.1 hypothetical protein A9K75_06570 [Campylobacter fetus subsp. testudinum]
MALKNLNEYVVDLKGLNLNKTEKTVIRKAVCTGTIQSVLLNNGNEKKRYMILESLLNFLRVSNFPINSKSKIENQINSILRRSSI